MTDNTQPEALRMANALEYCDASVARQAINELRRLHAENETLRAKLKTHEDLGDAGSDVQLLRMGYAAARLEIESLKSQSAAQRWNPMENGNSETALQMAAVIAHRDAAGMGDPLVVAAPTAQPAPQQSGVGNSGFDHKTAADFLAGKTVSDEAARKFVASSRWAHDDRAGFQATLLSVRHELASREAEITLLKTVLMNAEAAAKQGGAA